MKTLSEPEVRTIDVTVPGRLGFHLRLAAQFVERVQGFHSRIRIRKGELRADGKSILDLLVLGAAWKSKLQIEVAGEDAAQTVESIKGFFVNQQIISDSHR